MDAILYWNPDFLLQSIVVSVKDCALTAFQNKIVELDAQRNECINIYIICIKES